MADSARRRSARSARRWASSAAESLRTPSWNGSAAREVYPWGTIRTPDAGGEPARGRASCRRRSATRSAQRAWQYLEVVRLQELRLATCAPRPGHRRAPASSAPTSPGGCCATGTTVHLLVRRGHDRWRLDGHPRATSRCTSADLERPRRGRRRWSAACGRTGSFTCRARRLLLADRPRPDRSRTNVAGTVNLVRACLRQRLRRVRQRRLVVRVRLQGPSRPSEREWLEPNSHYAVHEGGGDALLPPRARSASDAQLRRRCGSTRSTGRGRTRTAHADARRARAARRAAAARDPETARDYVYVDDVCDAFVRAATRAPDPDGAVYNVGSGVQTSLARRRRDRAAGLGVAQEPRWGAMPTASGTRASGWPTRARRAMRSAGSPARRSPTASGAPSSGSGSDPPRSRATRRTRRPDMRDRWVHVVVASALFLVALALRVHFFCGFVLGDDPIEFAALIGINRHGPTWTDQLHVRFGGWVLNVAALKLFGVSESTLFLPTWIVSAAIPVIAYALLVTCGYGAGPAALAGSFVATAPFEILLGARALERPVPRARRRARLSGAPALRGPAAAAGRAARALLLVRLLRQAVGRLLPPTARHLLPPQPGMACRRELRARIHRAARRDAPLLEIQARRVLPVPHQPRGDVSDPRADLPGSSWTTRS